MDQDTSSGFNLYKGFNTVPVGTKGNHKKDNK